MWVDARGPGPTGPERGNTEWGNNWGYPDLRAGGAPKLSSPCLQPSSQDFSLNVSVPFSCFLFFYQAFPRGTWVSGHQSTSPLALCPAYPQPLFIRMFLYQCAWVCRDAGLSCCGIFISLPGSAFPPLCLTKPVPCFLFITQESQGRRGAQPWGGRRQGGRGQAWGWMK